MKNSTARLLRSVIKLVIAVGVPALEYVYKQYPELFTGMTPQQIMQEFADFHYDLELDDSKDYNEGWNRGLLCQSIGQTLVETRIKGGNADKQYEHLYAAMEQL